MSASYCSSCSCYRLVTACLMLLCYLQLVSQSQATASNRNSKSNSRTNNDQQYAHAERLVKNGQIDAAVSIYHELLRANSEDIYAIQGLALAHAQTGNLQEVATLFERAATIANSHELHYNAGLAYAQIGQPLHAKKNFQRCVDLHKKFKDCHLKLAQVNRDSGDYQAVQIHLHDAIQLDPGDPQPHTYLADTYNNLKQFDLAVSSYKQALALLAKGVQYMDKEQYRRLYVEMRSAMADSYHNKKDDVNAYQIYASLMSELPTKSEKRSRARGKSSASLDAPETMPILMGYLTSASELGIWLNYEQYVARLLTLAQSYNKRRQSQPSMPPNPLSPYRMLFLPIESETFLGTTNQWSASLRIASVSPDDNRKLNEASKKSVQRLNVGYISRRFHDYPGTQMMLRLFEHHNRTRIQTTLVASGPDDANSAYRAYLSAHADALVDISSASVETSLQTVSALDLDVVVDYDGLHDFNNVRLLSAVSNGNSNSNGNKVIMLTWLGFAGTTGQRGQSVFDYFIGDVFTLPADGAHTAHFGEKLLLMPHCYQPQDEQRTLRGSVPVVGDQPKALLQARLNFLERYQANQGYHKLSVDRALLTSSTTVWLVCFNRISKITPDAFADYMQILQSAPNAVLVLMAEASKEPANHLRLEASYHGVNPDRLVFLSRLPAVEYDTLLSICDLFLDTRIYGAHTIASDSMFFGLPVLSLPSDSFGSRVAGSLNKASGLDVELNMPSRRTYVETAVRIVRTKTYLPLKQRVLAAKGAALFNSSRFAGHLGLGYHATFEIQSLSYQPMHIFSGAGLYI